MSDRTWTNADDRSAIGLSVVDLSYNHTKRAIRLAADEDVLYFDRESLDDALSAFRRRVMNVSHGKMPRWFCKKCLRTRISSTMWMLFGMATGFGMCVASVWVGWIRL